MEYRELQAYFFLGILIGVGVLTVFLFLPFLDAVLLGGLFAVVFKPLYERFGRLLGGRETLAALVTSLVVLLLVLAPLVYFGTVVFQESKDLYSSFVASERGDVVGVGNEILTRILAPFVPEGFRPSLASAREYVGAILDWFVRNLGVIFSSTVKVAFTLVLSLFVFYFLLKDGRKLVRFLTALSPLADRYDRAIVATLLEAVRSVVLGTVVVAFVQGMLAMIGFFVFGIPHAAIWGVVAMIAALIPAVGTAIVTLPAAGYLLLVGESGAALGLFLWSLLLVGMIDNFLRPKLIERGTHLHPLLIFLSALGGIGLFGPIGFLAGPLVLSLFFALVRIYEDQFKEYVTEERT